jgi:hypothetical protein
MLKADSMSGLAEELAALVPEEVTCQDSRDKVGARACPEEKNWGT